MEKGPSRFAEYWTSEYNEGKHSGEHGKSMGYANNDEGKEAYSKAAQEFANSNSGTSQSFTTSNGTTYKYNPATNEFGIISKSGTIVTYFRPTGGIRYFLHQYEKFGGTWN